MLCIKKNFHNNVCQLFFYLCYELKKIFTIFALETNPFKHGIRLNISPKSMLHVGNPCSMTNRALSTIAVGNVIDDKITVPSDQFVVLDIAGMGPMPWTINSEIYPLWARSTGTSVATMVNWLSNLVISMTFLTLTNTLTIYGRSNNKGPLCPHRRI